MKEISLSTNIKNYKKRHRRSSRANVVRMIGRNDSEEQQIKYKDIIDALFKHVNAHMDHKGH